MFLHLEYARIDGSSRDLAGVFEWVGDLLAGRLFAMVVVICIRITLVETDRVETLGAEKRG